jgi:hypothetical protein
MKPGKLTNKIYKNEDSFLSSHLEAENYKSNTTLR